MLISHSYGTRPAIVRNTAQITRCLTGSASTPSSNKGPRRVPLAKDLGGISLDNSKNAEDKHKRYVPKMKDIGHTSEHINHLLSVRLQRRLSPALRTGPGPNRPEVNSGQRLNPTERRPQQQSQQQRRTPDSGAPRTSFSRPRNTGSGMRGPGRQGGTGKSTSSPRFPRRPSRSMTPRSRDVVEEPEEPVPPAPIPSRVYDMTSLPILTSPTQPLEPINRPSDVVQHVRETVGGDYSKWMSKEDTAAAGKDDVPSMARAKLALAFNSSISPQDRKRLLDTAETLLNRGKTVSVPVTSQ